MTIRVAETIVRLEGDCGVADAEPLSAALRLAHVTEVDLSACRSLHGAVAQALLVRQALFARNTALAGEASDPFLRDFVVPALLRIQKTEVGESPKEG